MLEEDEDTKTLSAPKILTLNNQEAVIVVGTRYPIISSETTTSTGNDPTISEELEYYESIGIQLNVVPQIDLTLSTHFFWRKMEGLVGAVGSRGFWPQTSNGHQAQMLNSASESTLGHRH